MAKDFKADVYAKSPKSEDEASETVAKLIPSSEVTEPEIQAWSLNNLVRDADQKIKDQEQAVYSQLEKKLQPEIQRQTEILKKEAYESAKKEGFDEGYDEGKKLGEQEARDIALAESEAQLSEKLTRLEALITSLEAPYKLLESQVFEHLSSLALHVAEEVIQQQISEKPEWVMKTIQEAIDALGDDLSPLEISLNPDDYVLIQSLKASFLDSWKVKMSDKVEAGTCQVRQNNSSIEHNWKNRFESMSVKLQAQAVAEKQESD
ncbi:MAG: FliH/SctL family protein [Pseudomonadota bacterium]|nr:FliH/SctL family protein [Pseudomonadota bacterium]